MYIPLHNAFSYLVFTIQFFLINIGLKSLNKRIPKDCFAFTECVLRNEGFPFESNSTIFIMFSTCYSQKFTNFGKWFFCKRYLR